MGGSRLGLFAAVVVGAVIASLGVGTPTSATAARDRQALARTLEGTWTSTGSMVRARNEASATRLRSGVVLVAGGQYFDDNSNVALRSAELYDPVTGTWTPTAPMLHRRWGQTATLLANGTVLVTGGIFGNYRIRSSAELYHPVTGTWTSAGYTLNSREYQTATLLDDGDVLVAGGLNKRQQVFASAELYHPASNTWTATGSMLRSRYAHAAMLLDDGEVLVAGGANFGDGGFDELRDSELYDPATGAWTATGSMTHPRFFFSGVVLNDGRALVVGSGAQIMAELYDPVTGTWIPAGEPRFGTGYMSPTLLASGRVLAVALGDGAAVYHPETDSWARTPDMRIDEVFATQTLLRSGAVLVAGGTDFATHGNGWPVNTAELYHPATAP